MVAEEYAPLIRSRPMRSSAQRIGCVLANLGDLEGERVRDRDVAGDMRKDHGILGSDGIELLAIRESFLGPHGMVPAATGDPLTCFMMRHGIGDALLHFLRRRYGNERDGLLIRSGATEMHVGVVKARHDELIVEMNCLDTFSAASAVEKAVRHLADAADLVVGDGHGLGPGLGRIIGVNAAVHVVGRVWSILLRALLCLESRDRRDHRKGEETQGEKEALRSGFHRDFSSATPEIPRRVRSVRFKPASRPAESYHSCKECAPPPLPPAPMERASMPIESGMFASVEERSMRDTLPTNSSAALSAASSGESEASSPPGRLPSSSTFHSSLPLER